MAKKENNKQLPLSLGTNSTVASEVQDACLNSDCNHIPDTKVIATSAFTNKRNEIKTGIYNSIVNRAKHLYD